MTATQTPETYERVEDIALALIRPNRWNRKIDANGLDIFALAASMQDEDGNQTLLQPIVLRHVPADSDGDEEYEIVAGERRYHAALRNGWQTIPAIVRDMDDRALRLAMAVENFQRKDPEPLEQAAHLAVVLEDTGGDIAEAAARLGSSESFVRRRARLASLSQDWRDELAREDTKYPRLRENVTWLEEVAKLHPDAQAALLARDTLRYQSSLDAIRASIRRSMYMIAERPWSAKFETACEHKCDACLKRTDCEADLFAEISPDFEECAYCTDPACYEEKTTRWMIGEWKKMKRKYKDLELCSTEFATAEIETLFPGESVNDCTDWHLLDPEQDREGWRTASGFMVDGPDVGQVVAVVVRKYVEPPEEEADDEEASAAAEEARQRCFAIQEALCDVLLDKTVMEPGGAVAGESPDEVMLNLLRLARLYGTAWIEEDFADLRETFASGDAVIEGVWNLVRASIADGAVDTEEELRWLCGITRQDYDALAAQVDAAAETDGD